MPPKPKKKNDVSATASRIEELRNTHGDSQTAFAERIGTLPSTVSKWEAGRNRPSPEIFARLAQIAKGEDKLYFLGEAGIPEAYFQRSEPMQKKEGKATDCKLLVKVIEAVETEMNRANGFFSIPARAGIIVQVYDEWERDHRRDRAIVKRLVSEALCPSNKEVRA